MIDDKVPTYRELLQDILEEVEEADWRAMVYMLMLGDTPVEIEELEANADLVGKIRAGIKNSPLFADQDYLDGVMFGDLIRWLADGYLPDGVEMPTYDE